MKRTSAAILMVLIFYSAIGAGCASTPKPVGKLTKPVDKTAEELVKVRELKSEGQTRAVISPADERQLRIPF